MKRIIHLYKYPQGAEFWFIGTEHESRKLLAHLGRSAFELRELDDINFLAEAHGWELQIVEPPKKG